MGYRLLADTIVVVHLGFVLFVVLGGLSALRWPRAAWIHLPAAAWGVFVEYSGVVCPLTPLEIAMRARGNEAGYAGGFVEHYLLPTIYPAGLTRHIQLVLGSLALLFNVAVYVAVLRRYRRRREEADR
jgi:Protein of Unknown function (DUF2784)